MRRHAPRIMGYRVGATPVKIPRLRVECLPGFAGKTS